MIFSDEKVNELKEQVRARLSEKRYLHTLSVAEAASRLCDMCMPEGKREAIIASLLHDVTKELSLEEQKLLLNEGDIVLDSEDLESVSILHSFTAPILIKKLFSEFATHNVLSSVRNHTIGSPDMSVFDEIIFLADFIEDTRTYESSVKLRELVYSNMRQNDIQNNLWVLHTACIRAIDCTVLHLIENKKKINSKNILTRNALLSKI